jgi:16S rRNA G527 N7-methylase RsmG
LQEIDLLFKTFILQISAQKNDETAVHESIRQLIEGLNTWNIQHNLIETEECHELIKYIYDVLDAYHCKDIYDAIDSLRQW